jgi:hypothetical protein
VEKKYDKDGHNSGYMAVGLMPKIKDEFNPVARKSMKSMFRMGLLSKLDNAKVAHRFSKRLTRRENRLKSNSEL